MKEFFFELQRFSIMPTLISDEDGSNVRYWNTVPGAEVAGFGGTFFVNHGANCVLQCGNVDSHVYNDTVAPGVRINGGSGNDYLINDGTSVNIYGNGGNDRLYNHDLGKKTNIYGGEGNDYIDNRATDVHVYAGDNDDYVWNNGSKVTIGGGSGVDEIYNHGGSKVSMVGGDNDDKIYNWGTTCTLEGGKGSDYLDNYASDTKIYGGDNDDNINNQSSNVTIDGGENNDYIYNKGGSKVSINGGDGDNILSNGFLEGHIDTTTTTVSYDNQRHLYKVNKFFTDEFDKGGDSVTITAGNDDDHIQNFGGSKVTIDAGNGKNTVQNGIFESHTEKINVTVDSVTLDAEVFITDKDFEGGDSVTIKTGGNDDEIFNRGSKVSINAGAGKNTIMNGSLIGRMPHSAYDYFYRDATIKGGNDVTINAGDNDDAIQSFKSSNVTINAGGGHNEISLFGGGSNVSIKGGNGDDSVFAYTPKYGRVNAETGELPHDSNFKGSYLTVEAGEGKNLVSIDSTWSYITVNGGNSSKYLDVVFNDGDNALINGNAGNDLIQNTGDYPILFGGADGDIITNYGNNAYINGEGGEDYIYSTDGDKVTVDGGKGSDTIEVYHDSNASIYGGAGNDRILVHRISGKDLDNIISVGSKAIVNSGVSFLEKKFGKPLTAGGWIKLLAQKAWLPAYIGLKFYDGIKEVFEGIQALKKLKTYLGQLTSISTINGGAGNDIIISDGIVPRVFEYEDNDTVKGGNDTIYNFTVENVVKTTLNMLTNDNFMSTLHIKSKSIGAVQVLGTNVVFNVGSGSIKLVDGANKKFKLKESDGTLTTRAYGKDSSGEVICSIFGSAGDDVIKDTAGDVKNIRYVLYGNAGNDGLIGNAKNDTLYGGAGNDELHGDAGDDVIYDGAGNNKLFGEGDADTIYSDTKSTVDGGDGADSIYNQGNKSTIDGGAGDDVIVNNYSTATLDGSGKIADTGIHVTLDGGIGNDRITNLGLNNGGQYVLIKGGANDDTISNSGDNVTIRGGKGNDLITLSEELRKPDGNGRRYFFAKATRIEYASGDGNDVIEGFNDDDTLKLTSGKVDAATVEGSDVVLTVGDGSIRMKNFKNKTFKLTATNGEVFKYRLSLDKKKNHLIGSIVGGKGQTTLYGTSGAEIYSGSKYGDLIYGNEGKDHLNGNGGNDTIYGGAGDDVLYGDGGTNTLVGGKGNDMIYAFGKGDFISYTSGDGSDTVSGSGTIEILGASYSSVASEGNMILNVGTGSVKLINNAKGNLFKVLGTCTNPTLPEGVSMNGNTMKITVKFKDDEIDLRYYPKVKTVDASKAPKGLEITGNDSANSFKGSNYSDIIHVSPPSASNFASNNSVAFSNDDLILSAKLAETAVDAVTISAGGGNDTIYGSDTKANIYSYAAGDGNDLIYNFGAADTLSITSGSYSKSKSGKNLVVTVGTGKITLKDAASLSKVNIIGTKVVSTLMTVTNSTSSPVTIDSAVKTVDASARTKAVKITGNSQNNLILGGKAADTLGGGAGNDTLTGGNGNDVFVYTAGKDVITDYAVGDKISIGADISKSTVSGTDAVFTIGSGTLTVKKAKGKKIAFGDAKGKLRTVIGGAQIFTDSSSAKVTLSSGVEVGDATTCTKAINLTGNALNNTILGGTKNDSLYGGKGNDSLVGSSGNDKLYGQAGADTLIGGAGNDSLWGGTGNDLLYGGDGKDVFIYKPDEGTDKIFDYSSGDMLKILKSNGNAGGTFKSSKYSGGDLTLTINGGGTVIFDGVSKGDKFNINGKTYTLGASKLK